MCIYSLTDQQIQRKWKLAEIEYVMNNSSYLPLFSYFNSSAGVNHIVSELPAMIQVKWTNRVVKFKPNFVISSMKWVLILMTPLSPTILLSPLRHQPVSVNRVQVSPQHRCLLNPIIVSSRKTVVSEVGVKCPIHNGDHMLTDCRVFRKKILCQNSRVHLKTVMSVSNVAPRIPMVSAIAILSYIV